MFGDKLVGIGIGKVIMGQVNRFFLFYRFFILGTGSGHEGGEQQGKNAHDRAISGKTDWQV
jgi:hypothetical protein